MHILTKHTVLCGFLRFFSPADHLESVFHIWKMLGVEEHSLLWVGKVCIIWHLLVFLNYCGSIIYGCHMLFVNRMSYACKITVAIGACCHWNVVMVSWCYALITNVCVIEACLITRNKANGMGLRSSFPFTRLFGNLELRGMYTKCWKEKSFITLFSLTWGLRVLVEMNM